MRGRCAGCLAWLLLGLFLARPASADTVVYYHTDALHSVAVVTNASGQVIERTHYAPYGQVLNRALRDGPGYTGHREDAATGLVYMQQRYYDPEAGRFLSADPVQTDDKGGNFNRYWYANDNPYRYTDPTGMCTGTLLSNCGFIASPTVIIGGGMMEAAPRHGAGNRGSAGRPSKPINDGRPLVKDEVDAAKTVYHNKIDYDSVRVVDHKFVFTQASDIPMTPNGNIYWPGACADLVACNGGMYQTTFIHEMMHVLQYQSGVNVLARGFFLQSARFLSFKLYNPYEYTYDQNRRFSSYNIEQQGDIAVQIFLGNLPNNIDYKGIQP